MRILVILDCRRVARSFEWCYSVGIIQAIFLRNMTIVGIAITPLRPSTPDSSHRKLIFKDAQKAYRDLKIEPRPSV
jgi:hypothetical protein